MNKVKFQAVCHAVLAQALAESGKKAAKRGETGLALEYFRDAKVEAADAYNALNRARDMGLR